ncbi:MAG: aldo/keto reductase [bacterium]
MEFKELGSTGVQLPEIGFGTWQYNGGNDPLQKGVALGASLIDTAEIYGTEGIVGQAIRGRRGHAFIATKVSGHHLGYDDVLRAADGSLRRLGVSQIDLYQIHWPDSNVPIQETMRAMEALVDDGKVRFIGVSNFSVEELREAEQAMTRHRIVSNQMEYSLLDRAIEPDLLPYCEAQRITILAYTPLAKGKLAAQRSVKHRHAFEVLRRIAQDAGKTTAQVALNWCTAKAAVIAIPKAGSVEHVVENCGASGWRLTHEQLAELDQAFNR